MTAMLTIGFVMVRIAVPEMPLSAAVMVAVPGARPVARPPGNRSPRPRWKRTKLAVAVRSLVVRSL